MIILPNVVRIISRFDKRSYIDCVVMLLRTSRSLTEVISQLRPTFPFLKFDTYAARLAKTVSYLTLQPRYRNELCRGVLRKAPISHRSRLNCLEWRRESCLWSTSSSSGNLSYAEARPIHPASVEKGPLSLRSCLLRYHSGQFNFSLQWGLPPAPASSFFPRAAR